MAAESGVDLKLRCAEGHLLTLTREIRRFEGRRPYSTTSYLDSYGSTYRVWHLYAEPTEQPPQVLSVLIGDFVHNVRSSLDHLVWHLSAPSARDRRTAFPIYGSRRTFLYGNSPKQPPLPPRHTIPTGVPKRSSGLYQIRGLPSDAQRAIEALQPYYRRQPRDLWLLHKFWNWDKHRDVLLSGYVRLSASMLVYPDRPDIEVRDIRIAPPGTFKKRVEVATVEFFGSGTFYPEVHPNFPMEVGFDKAPGVKGKPVLPLLYSILRHVRDRVVPAVRSAV